MRGPRRRRPRRVPLEAPYQRHALTPFGFTGAKKKSFSDHVLNAIWGVDWLLMRKKSEKSKSERSVWWTGVSGNREHCSTHPRYRKGRTYFRKHVLRVPNRIARTICKIVASGHFLYSRIPPVENGPFRPDFFSIGFVSTGFFWSFFLSTVESIL